VVIISCVRSNVNCYNQPPEAESWTRNRAIGFVADANRLNVALTRAKYALYIVGNFQVLQVKKFTKKISKKISKKNFKKISNTNGNLENFSRERRNAGAQLSGSAEKRERRKAGVQKSGSAEKRERRKAGAQKSGSAEKRERRNAGAQERGSAGTRECRNAGAQERGSAGTQDRRNADANRLNVALTRAKYALYIVGNFQVLQVIRLI
jgi:ATP-dependent exoDNAse (exonuclease V) beta subunit